MSNVIKHVCLHGTPKVLKPISCLTPNVTSLAAELVAEEHEGSKAGDIIAQAYQQAEEIIVSANLQSNSIQEKAQKTGFNQGYQEGQEQGRKSVYTELRQTMEEAAAKAQSLLVTAHKEAQSTIQLAEQEIITMAFAIADKVLFTELEKNREAILPVVRAALEKVRDQEHITILVGPEDYEFILQAKRELQIMVGREQALLISVDNTLTPGSCVIETANGTVDVRLDTQLEILRKALQDTVL